MPVLGGTITAQFNVPIYDNTLGVAYIEEVEIRDIAFTGSYTVKTCGPEESPEFDRHLYILTSYDELLGMVREWFDEWPSLVVLEAGMEALKESVYVRVFENIEAYEIEPDVD